MIIWLSQVNWCYFLFIQYPIESESINLLKCSNHQLHWQHRIVFFLNALNAHWIDTVNLFLQMILSILRRQWSIGRPWMLGKGWIFLRLTAQRAKHFQVQSFCGCSENSRDQMQLIYWYLVRFISLPRYNTLHCKNKTIILLRWI